VAPDLQKNPHAAAYVEATGVIGGNIRFELLLPDAWNGRFVMGGGGGFVGTVQNSARDSVNRGYATVGTDTGHEWQPGYMAGWAFTNMEAQLNFGYLAVHRTAEVAKAVIRSYYGADSTRCYFTGCSRGGGQALMEAQRYPGDFDGIVAGAPAFDWPGFAANAVAIQKALYPDPEHLNQTALDGDALRKLQRAILEQCDAQDGLEDGVVQDPPSARFDLAKVPGLTDEQGQYIPDTRRGPNAILTSGLRGLSAHRRGSQKITSRILCLPSAPRYSNTWFSIILIGIIRLTIFQILPATRS
jgi:feruloyl esterase